MEIKIVSHEEMRTERLKLMLEAEKLLAKIIKLNTRYSSKLRTIKNKIAIIEANLN